MNLKAIGKNIREYRKLKGFTQAELGQRADISTMSVRRYENGERFVNEETLKRIATALGVEWTDLIQEEEPDNEPDKMTTGQLIRQARKNVGMTQIELAKKIGIPFQSISRWENDKRTPKYDTIKRIASAIDIEPSELLEENADAKHHKDTASIYNEDARIKDEIRLMKMIVDDLYHRLCFTDEG